MVYYFDQSVYNDPKNHPVLIYVVHNERVDDVDRWPPICYGRPRGACISSRWTS